LNLATPASANPPSLHRRPLWVREAGREKATAKWSEEVWTKTLALWRDPAWGPPSGPLALSDTPHPSVKGSLIIIRVSMEVGGGGHGRPTKTWSGYDSYGSMAWLTHTIRNPKWLGKCVCVGGWGSLMRSDSPSEKEFQIDWGLFLSCWALHLSIL